MTDKSIVFFDGYCILCNGFVDFLIRKDNNNSLKYASLQGETAKEILPSDYLSRIDSVVFIDNQARIFVKSKAVIQILCTLGGFWKVLKLLNVFPKSFNDFFYDIIANNRYSWFGKNDLCRIPTIEEKEKILP